MQVIHRTDDESKFHNHIYTHIIRMVMVIGALLHEGTSPEHRTGYLTIYIGSLCSLQLIT